MGMFTGIKEARNKNKETKRQHLYNLAVDAVKNGTYKFKYGYNSGEALQEIEEVLREINEDLQKDRIVLKISAKTVEPCNIYLGNEFLGRFNFTIIIEIDAL